MSDICFFRVDDLINAVSYLFARNLPYIGANLLDVWLNRNPNEYFFLNN